ncbi:MAG: ABC transporter ATP-binding protein [Tenericutes bacterium]|nr:ABC transporter ATP-binding protein [Mycoplasmatota bacterium]
MKNNKPSIKETLSKSLKLISGYKKEYLLIILFCLLAALFSVLSPYFLGFATDSLYNSVKNNIDINYIYLVKILTIVLFCYIFDALCTYFKSYMSSKLGQKIGYNLRTELISKINKIKLRKLDTMKKGDIISKITNDVERLTDNLTQVIPELIFNFTLLLGVIIMMFVIDIYLALFTIIVIPITFFLLSFIVKRTQKYFELNQKSIGNINAFIEESVTNNDIIKSFNKEKYFNNKFDKESKELANYGFKSSFYSSLAVPFNKAIGNINYIIIVCVGAVSVVNGRLRLGAIQSFLQYMRDFNRPMNVISQVVANLQMAVASIDRINEILALEEEENGNITKFTFNDKIEFKNINFSYVEGKQVLKDFNLVINKGEKIAIVGKTGAGKTTIVNLLMNFYNNYEGEILIDGINIKDIDLNSYRDKISMVLQDTWLFEGTIKENIIFDHKISKKELEYILKKSKILHMIEGLPKGLDFEINEETNNMSAGERQLLTIARALVDNPDILILDEATSNVDTRIEYLINQSMAVLMKNRTSLVIAHRLSTIVESDKIIVIKGGKILEVGSHNELLKNKGYYYELYSSQFDLNE